MKVFFLIVRKRFSFLITQIVSFFGAALYSQNRWMATIQSKLAPMTESEIQTFLKQYFDTVIQEFNQVMQTNQ
jgi:hypothetical protein